MKDIDKRSGGGWKLSFLSILWTCLGVIPKWARSKNFFEGLEDKNVVQFRVNVGKKVTFCFLVAISAVRLSYSPGLHILRIYTVKGVDSPCACTSQVKLLEK